MVYRLKFIKYYNPLLFLEVCLVNAEEIRDLLGILHWWICRHITVLGSLFLAALPLVWRTLDLRAQEQHDCIALFSKLQLLFPYSFIYRFSKKTKMSSFKKYYFMFWLLPYYILGSSFLYLCYSFKVSFGKWKGLLFVLVLIFMLTPSIRPTIFV